MNFLKRTSFTAMLILTLGVCLAQTNEQTHIKDNVRRLLDRYRVLKSRSCPVVVVGPSSLENLRSLRWAENLVDSFEKELKVYFSRTQQNLIKIVMEGEPGEGEGKVRFGQVPGHNGIVQKMVMEEGPDLDYEVAAEQFCAMLVSRLAVARARTEAGYEGHRSLEKMKIPLWIPVGLCQNLYPELTARNGRDILGRWTAGRLPTVVPFINGAQTFALKDQYSGKAGKTDRAISGFLVRFLLSLEDGEGVLLAVIDECVSGNGNPSADDIAAYVPGCSTAGDLAARWDAWVLGLDRVVFTEAYDPDRALRKLTARLLISPGEFGMPLHVSGGRKIGYGGLAEFSGADWVGEVCSGLSSSLRVLKLGATGDFSEVVDLYCRFLAATARGENDAALAALLDKADGKLADLRSALAGSAGKD